MSDIKITVEERAGRQCASSGSKWEPIMGYSRAVRSGNHIAVTGCVGVNADGTYAKSVGEQTARSLAIIQRRDRGPRRQDRACHPHADVRHRRQQVGRGRPRPWLGLCKRFARRRQSWKSPASSTPTR